MTVSTSRLAYEDCYTVMMAALEDSLGVRIKMASANAATHFRLRCHQARQIDRKENALTYERPHPLHGVSQFDKLILRISEDDEGAWVMIEQNSVIPGEVHSLTTGEQVTLEMPQLSAPPKQIEASKSISDEDLAEAFQDMPTVDGEILRPLPKSQIRRV